MVCASNSLGRQDAAFLSGWSGPLLPSPSQRTEPLHQNGHCNRQTARRLRANTSAFDRTSTLRRRLGSSAEQASPLLGRRRPHLSAGRAFWCSLPLSLLPCCRAAIPLMSFSVFGRRDMKASFELADKVAFIVVAYLCHNLLDTQESGC